MLKMTRVILSLALLWLASAPALAQSTPTQKFSAYVLNLTPVVTLTGTERIFALQAGVPVTTTPQQIISSITTLPTLTITNALTLGGAVTTVGKPSQFGTASGANATSALALGDANILLYNLTSVNWAGIGTDTSGNFWVRTGLSGTPIAALWIDTSQSAHITSTVVSTSTTTGALTVAGGAGVGGALNVGNNITISGTSVPQLTYSPSSGATKLGQLYQQGDFLQLASAGVSVWAVLSLTTGQFVAIGPTGGLGYGVGAGGAVTQITSRTTGVTLNNVTGAITLFSAAGSATPASFTVTNSTIAATDIVKVVQKSGTDLYEIFVTSVGVGSFKITFFTTGGTTTEQPVFNFAVIRGSIT